MHCVESETRAGNSVWPSLTYGSSHLYCTNAVFAETGLRSATQTQPLSLHPAQEFIHDAAIQILAEIRVLDTGVDRRVVIDFDDHDAIANLFQVDAVKAMRAVASRYSSSTTIIIIGTLASV